MYPTTGGQTSSGHPNHDLKPEAWVIGFFADGDDCQQPIIIGTVGGGTGSSNIPNPGGGTPTPGLPNPNPTPPNPGETINLKGNGRVEQAYNFFREKFAAAGSSPEEAHVRASGMVGSLMVESGASLNPQAKNPNGGAYGIAQWLSKDRVANLRRMYGIPTSFENQLSFIWWELNNPERRALQLFVAAKTLDDAVHAAAKYERAEENNIKTGVINKQHKNYQQRYRYAQQVYNTMKNRPQK
jgi:hypothetical protein